MGFIDGWVDKFRGGNTDEASGTEESNAGEGESTLGKSPEEEMRYRKLRSERLT